MSDLKSIPERWAAAWSQDNSAAFTELFSPKAVCTDHAFQVVSTNISGHHKIWRAANPDFKVILDPSTPIWWATGLEENGKNGSCSFRTINYETFTGDLPTRKASGKSFQFSTKLHLTIKDGLIVSMDEFYRDSFDGSVPPEKFRMTGS
ncbi:hypothetical protein LA080_007315 [Diaporthe eres]|nr:hypothetical protein LA080_007315 [Diaporthe eres]